MLNRIPQHCRHHGPAGLHQTANRLQEMRDLGFSDNDIQVLVSLLKSKLPRGFSASAEVEGDEGVNLAEYADETNREVLGVLRNSMVLIAGELMPHLICLLLDEGVSVIQVHDSTPHGHRPPHFRDLASWYPERFRGVLSFTDVKDVAVTAILIDTFLDENDIPHASPLAMMAARFWPKAKVVAVLSEHRAPHHVAHLGRDVDLFLFWE